MKLVLSIFPGIDLLGRGFAASGFAVVRGPDPIFGGDVRDFHAPAGHFTGVIGGPPCQDFSRARRDPATGNGLAMLAEFRRLVTEARPDWWLMENVPGVPDMAIDGFTVQRFNLNARECGLRQNRPRVFQFGRRDGPPLVIVRSDTPAEVEPCCLASEGERAGRRRWDRFCALQGLPPGFDLPGWSVAAKYRAVGNGVPVPMARVIAAAIAGRRDTAGVAVCPCECGRPVTGKQTFATAACRKRMQRRRDAAGVTRSGPDTGAESQESVSHRSPPAPGKSHRDRTSTGWRGAVTLVALLALAGCRAPGTRLEPPQPPLPARMAAPSLQSVPAAPPAALTTLPAPGPLRIVHPLPGWRAWNPVLRKTITTTNTGLYVVDWVAPEPGRAWLLQSSTDLSTWSEGIPVGDRWQGQFPFRDQIQFFRVQPHE